MTTYAVIDNASLQEVYRYSADAPIEWTGFEFATHAHVECPDAALLPVQAAQIVWAPIDFLRRFTAAERIAARAARRTDAVLDDFYSLLEQAPAVRSDDPDVIAGLGYMTHTGLLAPGRDTEILSG